MATSTPITLTFTKTDGAKTQAQLNADVKQLSIDAIKQALPQLNGILALQTPLTTADIDAASNNTLTSYLGKLTRDHFGQLAKGWRVQAADTASVKPVRDAGNELDPVP